MLFDSSAIHPASRKAVITHLKREQNFFKHADLRKASKSDAIDFDPSTRSETFFYMTIRGLGFLGHPLTELQMAFMVWLALHRPAWMTNAVWLQVAQHGIPVEVADILREKSRSDFLQTFNQSRGA